MATVRRGMLLRGLMASAMLSATPVLMLAQRLGGGLPRAARSFVSLKHYVQQPNGKVVETVGRFPSEVVAIARDNLMYPGSRLVGVWRGVNRYVVEVQLRTDPVGRTVTGSLITRRGGLLLKAAERSAGIRLPYWS